ncbi:MAG: HD domain-containing protein [Chitinophagaceae bacterium]
MSREFSSVYDFIYNQITNRLQLHLSPYYTYHSLDHTLDVLKQSQQIAARENITDDEELFLLNIAVLYHDIGFLNIYSGHEEKGCELVKNELPVIGFNHDQIHKICGLIMATKIPQSPKNKLEEIICDADLDYLGRNDFEQISNQLYKEFLHVGFVKNYADWMQKQIGFFESHQYFTKSSQLLRQPLKMDHLLKIKATEISKNQ